MVLAVTGAERWRNLETRWAALKRLVADLLRTGALVAHEQNMRSFSQLLPNLALLSRLPDKEGTY